MSDAFIGPLRLATDRFVAFFRELQGAFVEREDLLQQIALALLSRQHVLMTGPPGTAKSQLAHAVLGRIVSEETGRPSLFARQFTESTVQTDLVGPIDFKTLMETGRTEHFTDEGILGAVHAFLDEVFDGRDMLLRSTLNVLQERELKEGTKTTAGRIECALMTTNRYLAEILDNERLVAFVDRIAFLSFVPKGFATPDALEAVLLAQVAGRKPPELVAPLTIQDLDLLQHAVDGVYIDDGVCASLAQLVRTFERELATAHKANPSFVPSRYLSTRTAVRLGGLLRAICFMDRIFADPRRPLEVLPRDLAHLRLGMTLCGPTAEQAAQLLAAEPDARERRQLAIVRSEREIFERCLAALTPPAANDGTARTRGARPIDRQLLKDSAPGLLRGYTGGKLLELSRALAVAATSGQRDAELARRALTGVLDELSARALRSGLAAATADDADPASLVASLAVLAGEVESAGKDHTRAARWLRARGLEIVDRAVQLNAARIGEVLSTLAGSSGDLSSMRATVDALLRRAEGLARLRDGLRHAGTDETDAHARDQLWAAAAGRLAEGLLPMLSAGLPLAAAAHRDGLLADAARRAPAPELARELAALDPVLWFARECCDRLEALGASDATLFSRLVAPLIAPAARAAITACGDAPPTTVTSRLEDQMAALSAGGVLQVVPPADLLAWVAGALLRAQGQPPPVRDLFDLDGYRALRAALARGTLASLIVDFYLRIVPNEGRDLRDPDLVVKRVAEAVEAFPAETREALARRDLAQLEAELAYLERWWANLAGALPADQRPALERVVASRFFQLTHDEGALTRFALEARLVGMVFGAARVEALVQRAESLERSSAAVAQGLMTWRAGQPATATGPIKPPRS
jgi:MoxR-like ATPase